MLAQILSAVLKEVVESPMNLVAEIVQFLALAAIIWIVAFGFGKRRGFVVNMLDERQHHVRGQLDQAAAAQGQLEEARASAEKRLGDASAEASRLQSEAETEVTQSEAAARASSDAEAERIVERAKSALTNERVQMLADLRDELVDLVSEATRSIMNEALTVAEQRDRIEGAIKAGVSGDGDHATGGRRRRASAEAAVTAREAD